MSERIRSVNDLSQEELEDCFDGSSSVEMVREIFEKHGVINDDGYVDIENFAEWFAYGVEGFIDAEEGSEEYEEAWNNNYDWGMSIAENINYALDIDEPDEYN